VLVDIGGELREGKQLMHVRPDAMVMSLGHSVLYYFQLYGVRFACVLITEFRCVILLMCVLCVQIVQQ